MMNSLKDIGNYYKTDKAYDHNYCDFYDEHLNHLRDKELKLLEIGIFAGASLRMWSEYFKNAKIYGVDLLVEPQCVLVNEGNIKSYRLDQGSESELYRFVEEHGPFDIIIDDGSHFTHHQLLSYKLFGHKTPIFIWEDLHTSRIPHYVRSGPSEELPLDIAQRRAEEEDNCFIFDRDGDENHVTFLVKNSDIK